MILETKNNKILQEDLEILANSNLSLGKLKNKIFFITGATGLVGSQLVRALGAINRIHNLNMEIILFIRNEEKAKNIYGDFLEREDIKVVLGDVLDKDINLGDIKRIDYIVHAAAVTTSKTMIERPIDVIDISVNGTKNMLELSTRMNAEFLYISSMEVYGKFIDREEKVTENDLGQIDILNVRSNYPESKRLCENLCIAYQKQYNIPVYIARLAQTFGAGILPGENRVFAQFAKSAINKKDIVLHTKGLSEGNYCYTRDMVLGLLTILLNGEKGNAYNVVNEANHTTISGMAKLVCEKIANNEIKVIFDIPEENIYGYPADTKMKLSSEKLEALGWKPTVGLEEAYKRMIKSMENKKDKCEINNLKEEHQNKSYIDFKIFFNSPLEENKDISFKEFSEDFIEDIILFSGDEESDEATRELRFYINVENLEKVTSEDSKMLKLSENDLKKIEDKIEELLIKLILYTKVVIIKYEIVGSKILKQYMATHHFLISSKPNNFIKLELNKTELKSEINFNKNREKYRQIIGVLRLVSFDPVVCFLVLYDLLLLWTSKKEKKKLKLSQNDIINYVKKNISELEQYDDKFKLIKTKLKSTGKEKEEDSLTNLRNDISHSGERLESGEAKELKNKARNHIQPLLYLMHHYIFNCKS